MTLRVALVGGPMYDGCYERLGLGDRDDVEVVIHADHPTLNRRVAEALGAGERIDVLSTHGKYAPSQAAWLRPLDDVVDPGVLAALSPAAVELCRVDGRLLSVPRLIDVRIMWADPARYEAAGTGVPDTFAEVSAAAAAGAPFGMPGRESGLFGTFFELVVGAGGRLLSGGVALDRDVALDAAWTLAAIAAAGPADLVDWHYDQVDDALASGVVAAAGAWPGATARLRAANPALRPYPYPAGPVRRVTYAGCHSWAVPVTCGDLPGALALLAELCGPAAHAADAAAGSVCARTDVFAAVEPVDEVDARRLELTREAIATQMITYPPLERFPEIEDASWLALRDMLTGRRTPAEAVDAVAAAITRVVGDGPAPGADR